MMILTGLKAATEYNCKSIFLDFVLSKHGFFFFINSFCNVIICCNLQILLNIKSLGKGIGFFSQKDSVQTYKFTYISLIHPFLFVYF